MLIKTKPLFIVAYVLHILWIIILSSVPPVSRDAITHHLAIPKMWIAHGGIYEIPEILFSYYPQLIDLLYVIPLLFGQDIAAKYIHFSFALLTAYIIFLFVQRKIGSSWGALAGLLFLTIPLIVKLSVTVYVDLGLIFFITGALFSIVLWLEDIGKTRWLVLAAICGGLALSTKYNAIISLLIINLLVPFFFLRRYKNRSVQQIHAVKFAMLFTCIAILIFSPWMIRNASLTGNPIYPLYHQLFINQPINTDGLPDNEAYIRQTVAQSLFNKVKPLGPLLTRKLVYDETLPYTLLIPLRIFYEGKDNNPKYFDGKLNLLLLLLPLALFLPNRKKLLHSGEISFFTTYIILLILFTFFTIDIRARYIAPILPPLVVLSTYGIYTINRWWLRRFTTKTTAHSITSLLVIIYLLPNIVYSYNLHKEIEPITYLSGKVSRPEYIQQRHIEYATITLANKIVPKNGKVLGLYLGHRHYYFDIDTVLLNSLFTKITYASTTTTDIANQLDNLGYTHLLLRHDLFNGWLDSIDTAAQQRVVDFFTTYTKKEIAREGYGLYTLFPHTTDRSE